MAKRRDSAETEAHTKKLKQVKKATSSSARSKKKHAAVEFIEKEEELVQKAKPKPRLSSDKSSASKVKNMSAGKASPYFQSPVKEESNSEDDFDMVTSASPPMVEVEVKKQEKEEDSEDDEDDWEEVEELEEPLGPVEQPEPVLPSEPVEIEIETPEVRKKKKRQAEFENYLRRMMNRLKKDLLIDTHKVHLMCLIASGMFRNRVCCEPDLLAITLSLLPVHFGNVVKERIDQTFISGLLKWFRDTFTLNPSLPYEERHDLRALLERRLGSVTAKNHQEMTHLFLLVLRSLQLFSRLVLSLQPIPLKEPSAKGKGTKTSIGASKNNPTNPDTSKTSSPEPNVSLGTKRPATGGKLKGERGGKKVKSKGKGGGDDEEMTAPSGGQKPKNSKRRSVASKVSYREESNSDEENEKDDLLSDEEFQAASEEDSGDSESSSKFKKVKKGTGKAKSKNSSVASKRNGKGKKQKEEKDWEEEEGEEDEGTTGNGVGKRKSENRQKGPGADEWLEVYLERTSSWLCVDIERGVGMPHLCSQNATAPVTYVVSVDNDGFVKDLGKKYDPTWMTSSRRRRVDEDWWEETLEPFLGPDDEKDKHEDKELQRRLLNKPMPISIAEYKNHPLYALKRHLLKYEAIYPTSATVLGHCRGEPVYSRDCVHTLHSRDTWLKEARTVRLGEEPYKMVRGFSNRSRKARMMSEMKDENDLPLFGEWQTEEYQPPIAVDGKVPRNDYGNVYLFKPCMLPVGCVHIRLPNLHRVAKKLDVDAAPAVTGFDFHGGYSHAVTDGYIVCEEHEEILRAAWVEEQELQKHKEKEKREKRAVSNWTLLVKGLLIRERLKQRYGQKSQALRGLAHGGDAGGFSSDEESIQVGDHDARTASETLAMSWPQNRQAEEDRGNTSGLKKKRTTKQEKKAQDQHLFPFEKL